MGMQTRQEAVPWIASLSVLFTTISARGAVTGITGVRDRGHSGEAKPIWALDWEEARNSRVIHEKGKSGGNPERKNYLSAR